MFSIVKKLLPSSDGIARRSSVSGASVASDVDGSDSKALLSSRSRSSGPGTLIHRNLCVVVLRDTLRMYGIPREWIGIEVKNLSGDANTVQLQIIFVVRHWHEGLLKYVPALQRQFLQSLQSFDSETDYSRQLIFWRFSAKCNYPHTEIPGPSYWGMPELSDSSFQDVKTTPQFNLPPMHLNRDHERAQNADSLSTVPQSIYQIGNF
jgi:hypothetical protein